MFHGRNCAIQAYIYIQFLLVLQLDCKKVTCIVLVLLKTEQMYVLKGIESTVFFTLNLVWKSRCALQAEYVCVWSISVAAPCKLCVGWVIKMAASYLTWKQLSCWLLWSRNQAPVISMLLLFRFTAINTDVTAITNRLILLTVHYEFHPLCSGLRNLETYCDV